MKKTSKLHYKLISIHIVVLCLITTFYSSAFANGYYYQTSRTSYPQQNYIITTWPGRGSQSYTVTNQPEKRHYNTHYPTPTVTPTITPTVTPSPTPFPRDCFIEFSFKLVGIGNSVGDNTNPLNPTRTVWVQLFNQNNTLVKEETMKVMYERSTGLYKGRLTTSSLEQAGPYQVKVRFDNTLNKLIPTFVHIKPGETTIVPLLIIGSDTIDINQDNILDLNDYNVMRDCIKSTCYSYSSYRATADINDDGRVEEVDVNILHRGFASRRGD